MRRPSLPTVFSPRRFARALALSVAGFLALALLAPGGGGLDGLIGLAAGTALDGAVADRRAAPESGGAGAVAAGVAAVATQLLAAVQGGPLPVPVVGAGGGLVAGVAGQWIGWAAARRFSRGR